MTKQIEENNLMKVTLPKKLKTNTLDVEGFDKTLVNGEIIDVKGFPLGLYNCLIKQRYFEEIEKGEK